MKIIINKITGYYKMSCAGKGYGTNPQSNEYLTSQFISSGLISSNTSYNNSYNKTKSTRNCRRLNKGFYPSFTPELLNLSVTTSAAGRYSLVYINGSNFLPNGTTFVQFGSLGYLPVTYYGSFNLSFVVPLNAVAGNYPVKVVNLYNGNFSPAVNQSYSGILNFSQPITYTIT
jgi:hypothetical protein